MSSTVAYTVPRSFLLRRLHSLTGLMLTVYLVEHILTNSQAALWLGGDGLGFIQFVNFLHSLPYLPVLEWLLIGIPLLIHGGLGIQVALQARFNSFKGDGRAPSLPQYGRNRAYTWQRLTAWILLVGILAHVVHMRFLRLPEELRNGIRVNYLTRLEVDPGLYTVADRLQVALFSPEQIEQERQLLVRQEQSVAVTGAVQALAPLPPLDRSAIASRVEEQHLVAFQEFVEKLSQVNLGPHEVVGVSDSFGTAMLLVVRDCMKSLWICGLYSILVLTAAFHGYNGLWTFLITWGCVLKASAQRMAAHFCMGLFGLFTVLGLAAVWGTYWLNLYR